MARKNRRTRQKWIIGAPVLPATGLNEPSFYAWRKRLRREEPLRFALVEPLATAPVATAPVELLLASGERLRIGAGADAPTIRAVIQALRA